MGTISEKPSWIKYIYRIQMEDPLQGGEDGIINIPTKQLANRTQYLYEVLHAEHNFNGEHCITGDMLRNDAGLKEYKLSLTEHTKNLQDDNAAISEELKKLKKEIEDVAGEDGSKLRDLVKSVLLSWKYAKFGYEAFTGKLVMRNMKDKSVDGGVTGDDSITCTDNFAVPVGNCRLLLYNEEKQLEVTPKVCLKHGRVLLDKPLPVDMLHGTLSHTNWELHNGYAVGHFNQVYISTLLELLSDVPYGNLLITLDKDYHEKLKVYSRDVRSDGDWREADYLGDTESIVLQRKRDCHYRVQGGFIQLKIETTNIPSLTVYRILVYPQFSDNRLEIIKTPKITSHVSSQDIDVCNIKLAATPYRNIYGDPIDYAEYHIFSKDGVEKTLFFHDDQPHDLDDPDDIFTDKNITIEARYKSDVGDYSDWDRVVDLRVFMYNHWFGFKGNLLAGKFNKDYFWTLRNENLLFGFEGTKDTAGFDKGQFIIDASYQCALYFGFQYNPLSGAFNEYPFYTIAGEPIRFGFEGLNDAEGFDKATFIVPDGYREPVCIITQPKLIGIVSGTEIEHDAVALETTKYHNSNGYPLECVEYRIFSGDLEIDRVITYPDETKRLWDKDDHSLAGRVLTFMCRHKSITGMYSDWDIVPDVAILLHRRYFGFEGCRDADEIGHPFYFLADEVRHFGFEGSEESGGFDTALFKIPENYQYSVITTPEIIGISPNQHIDYNQLKLSTTKYHNIYGDAFKCVQYKIVSSDGLIDLTLEFPDTNEHLLIEDTTLAGSEITIMCRHISVSGDVSNWFIVPSIVVNKIKL